MGNTINTKDTITVDSIHQIDTRSTNINTLFPVFHEIGCAKILGEYDLNNLKRSVFNNNAHESNHRRKKRKAERNRRKENRR